MMGAPFSGPDVLWMILPVVVWIYLIYLATSATIALRRIAVKTAGMEREHERLREAIERMERKLIPPEEKS